MFRRIAAVSTTSVVAVRTISSTSSSLFGSIPAKVDYHKDSTPKFVSKIAFNPYSAGFMENLEKQSLAAGAQEGNSSNHFQTYQHIGSFVMADHCH